MSAPDTNVEKQVRRHRGPLAGIVFGLVVAGGLFAAFMAWTAYQGDSPTDESPAAATAADG